MAYEYHELSMDSMITQMDGETVRKIVAVNAVEVNQIYYKQIESTIEDRR